MSESANAAKLPPHSVEAEKGVLGSILINPDALYEVNDFLKPEDFYILRNGYVFEAIQNVEARGEAIDNLTVIVELRRVGRLEEVGGSAYITELMNNTPTHLHAETYGRMVERAAIRRRLIAAAGDIARTAWDENSEIGIIQDKAHNALDKVTSRTSAGVSTSFRALARTGASRAWDYKHEPKEIRGWATGILPLDQAFTGLLDDDLFVITGLPGSGKSTLLMQIILKLAEQGPGILFPTEMSGDLLMDRLACFVLGINYKDFRLGRISVDDDILIATYDLIGALPVSVFNHPNPTPAQIKAYVRSKARQGLAKWVAVDGINDIAVPGEVYERTSAAVDALYDIAYSGILTVTTCHVNREPTKRGSKAPTMFDAQGSGKIGQRATRFISIYREGYSIETGLSKRDKNKPVDNDLTWLLIGKDRHTGMIGKRIKTKFIRNHKGCGFYPVEIERQPPSLPLPVPFYGDRNDE